MRHTLIPLLTLSFLLLASCAHHRDVRPAADGIHRVSVKAESKDEGSRDAIAQAEHYCKEKNKEAAFVEEKQDYTGSMDEKSYNNAKTATKVGQAVGGAGYVFGGKNESTAGGILGLGSGIANSALGEGYTVTMKFKCQ